MSSNTILLMNHPTKRSSCFQSQAPVELLGPLLGQLLLRLYKLSSPVDPRRYSHINRWNARRDRLRLWHRRVAFERKKNRRWHENDRYNDGYEKPCTYRKVWDGAEQHGTNCLAGPQEEKCWRCSVVSSETEYFDNYHCVPSERSLDATPRRNSVVGASRILRAKATIQW
jgi:hypothetical protein